jgi:predicted nucleic acid-binding protein/GNAT superfamily N-acetyltransferase
MSSFGGTSLPWSGYVGQNRPVSVGDDHDDPATNAVVVSLCDPSHWTSVVALGDLFKRYLGLYPAGAVLEAIRDERVIGAFRGTELLGYALFDLPRSDIRLVHLCIAEGSRRLGIARMLVDEIQERHPDRDGIRRKCRRDYEAHRIWPKLGFQAQSLPSGRGKQKADMTAWWRGFGGVDLFGAALEDEERVLAVLDTNVVLDIILERNPTTAQYLGAPGLDDEVVFCLTRSVKNELADVSDSRHRRTVMERLAQFQELTGELVVCDELTNELVASIPQRELERDPSLKNDARVVAECIVAGASVLLTNDDNAGKILRSIANVHGLEILHPSQLVVVIDELKGVRRDAPDRIQNTAFVVSQAAAGVDRELDHMVSSHLGETKADFVRIFRSKATWDVRLVHTADSLLADGLVVSRAHQDVLDVELFRVRKSPLGPTLLKQLLFQLRQQALKGGLARIVISDPKPGGGEVASQILVGEGARLIEGKWTIEVVDAQVGLDEIARGGLGAWMFEPWMQTAPKDPGEFARLERELWPLKIRGSALQCYVIPIRQSYASELLGYDAPLLDRADTLGISRRHVYYKSPNFHPTAPGRILWYVSGKAGGVIVAASQLLSTHLASPRTLHSRFRKYGVWALRDIEECARQGSAVALRFGDTEVFRHQLKRSEADEITMRYGNKLGTIPTVRRISDGAFHEIYSIGMDR